MIYGSVCSGIEAATVAWHPLGWRPAFFAEIAKFPRAVLAHHYPDVPLHGDFTKIQAGDVEPIDLLVGGTPCQDFSVAGLRAGLAGDRGGLTLEFARLAKRLRPRWLSWENVPGVLSIDNGRAFGSYLGLLGQCGYGFAYRILDAQFSGVPQRRRRVHLVGYLGDWRCAAAVLFDAESLRWNSPPRRQAREGIAVGSLVGTSPGGGWRLGLDEAAAGQIVSTLTGYPKGDHPGREGLLVAGTLGANGKAAGSATQQDAESGLLIARSLTASTSPYGRLDAANETFVTHALRAEGFDASEDGTGRGTPLVPVSFDCKASGSRMASADGHKNGGGHLATLGQSGVRRLTPRECERLQGFPDDYTLIPYRGKPASDGPRYMALGNSMPVTDMRWLGERIQHVDNLIRITNGLKRLGAA